VGEIVTGAGLPRELFEMFAEVAGLNTDGLIEVDLHISVEEPVTVHVRQYVMTRDRLSFSAPRKIALDKRLLRFKEELAAFQLVRIPSPG
jgi:hypothetical protein